ncbi:MAG: Asp-tRNA(Asn)/Glu-tRNA(Gln) amidotransferase subunit GatC [Acidobacteriota bacterium]|nr:Asp-tRNA(Asn)/Glu-tRNA(Gln) amidotransferase subunit GatC [Acidobacteriota bacterium]MDW3228273.1 Asp-tRNA(Asn)/Glu-tRNA(Gln) amidotransferase subunit GatC [Acidobacteriota bacterium]MDY0230984.1 Asp-tRNA(Asn)/Glu-tRNA(Gln) amidotransferase subunit GatC [Candidatus Saccharicenans sp.]
MKIDLNNLSRLANLELTEDEKELLPGQMEKIIDWVGQLSTLQIDGEEKFISVDFNLRLDEDLPRESLPQSEVLSMAPEAEGDYIKVPRVLTEK